MRNVFLVTSVLALCTACGDANNAATDAGADGGPPDGETLVVNWGPLEVQPGTEETQCVLKRLGNTERIRIKQIHNVLGATSHHFILSGSTSTIEQPDPAPCFPFSHSDVPLMITQKADDQLVLPDGVGFTLEANQMVSMELHFINVSAAPQMATATTTFTIMPDDEFEHEAGYVFLGGNVPTIGANSEGSSGPDFVEVPDELAAASFFAITGHQHQWGTNVFIATTPGPGGPDTAVYDLPDFNWDEPETLFYDPPFTIPPGGGFRIGCDWFNASDEPVSFGLGVEAEMCFFWAYYFL